MRQFVFVLLIISLAGVAFGQDWVPMVEQPFNASGGWRFTGYSGKDAGPDLIEIKANGGLALVTIYDTVLSGGTMQVKSSLPSPRAPWWTKWLSGPDIGKVAPNVGTSAYIVDSEVRPLVMVGTGVDSLNITLVTASDVLVTLSRKAGR